jgi:hypothetical protein
VRGREEGQPLEHRGPLVPVEAGVNEGGLVALAEGRGVDDPERASGHALDGPELAAVAGDGDRGEVAVHDRAGVVGDGADLPAAGKEEERREGGPFTASDPHVTSVGAH